METWAWGMMLPNVPGICIAAAEWLSALLAILQLPRKIRGWRLAVVSGLFLIVMAAYQSFGDRMNGPGMLLFAVGSYILIFLFQQICCRTGVWNNGFLCVEAFVLADLAMSFGWLLFCYVRYGLGVTGPVVGAAVIAVAYALIFGGMWFLSHRYLKSMREMEVTKGEFLTIAVMGAVIFLVSNISVLLSNSPFSTVYSSTSYMMRVLINLGGVTILFCYNVLKLNRKSDYELKLMESMLEHQYRQYQQSRETMERINYEYHDLKNQILILKAETDDQQRMNMLNQMEESISIYETQNETGNKVLDIILTNKSLECQNHGILLTTVANGELLNFMGTADIGSIFGNALDNAIECERKIEDKDKRIIHLVVDSQRSFLIIKCENYCEEQLHFDQSLPRTTKKDKSFHGYGLKSIRQTARKYAGEMKVSIQNNWFVLKILIPLPADGAFHQQEEKL